jgi:hypothetical protein
MAIASTLYNRIASIPAFTPLLPLLAKIIAPSSICYGYVQQGFPQGNLLGGPLFKSQFVVFEAIPGQVQRVGFATKS